MDCLPHVTEWDDEGGAAAPCISPVACGDIKMDAWVADSGGKVAAIEVGDTVDLRVNSSALNCQAEFDYTIDLHGATGIELVSQVADADAPIAADVVGYGGGSAGARYNLIAKEPGKHTAPLCAVSDSIQGMNTCDTITIVAIDLEPLVNGKKVETDASTGEQKDIFVPRYADTAFDVEVDSRTVIGSGLYTLNYMWSLGSEFLADKETSTELRYTGKKPVSIKVEATSTDYLGSSYVFWL